jgi:hypothetical protein
MERKNQVRKKRQRKERPPIRSFGVALFSVDHPWRMTPADDLRAFALAKRKIEGGLRVELRLMWVGTAPEPEIVEPPIWSQIAGAYWYKFRDLYPTKYPSTAEIHAFLIRPSPVVMDSGRTLMRYCGRAPVGEAALLRSPECISVSSSAYDDVRKAPTRWFVSGLMLAHEIAHLLGAEHDDSNVNIMSKSINNYSRYTRGIGFNKAARLQVKAKLTGGV